MYVEPKSNYEFLIACKAMFIRFQAGWIKMCTVKKIIIGTISNIANL